jgi:hypothetical protein
MKVEYLPDGSPDCPLIRLFDASIAEFTTLHDDVDELAKGLSTITPLHKRDHIQLINLTGLTIVASRERGGVQERKPGEFYWHFSQERWSTVAGLIKPFTAPPTSQFSTHQWLCGKEALLGLNASQISVLISRSPLGQW